MNDKNISEEARESYWNQFYAARAATLGAPSQFALFVLGETDNGCAIVDVGCGTGRDALYFASQGRKVVGVDASVAGVEHCAGLAADNALDAKFIAAPIDSHTLAGAVQAVLPQSGLTCVYARFFIHAINDDEEQAFLALASTLCREGDRLAVEFRTLRDAQLAKETGAHYRRYVNPLTFIHRAISHGFSSEYFVEGFGYAKYKNDDAHVARCVLRKGNHHA
jgi:ubiquinone/menaquinone biosynthesis C-methylase UbiE